MTQTSKTMIFAAIALVSTVLAWASRPADVTVQQSEDTGALFSEFTDPSLATSLKIVRFDESLASLNEIEVSKSDGIWTLPSHDGYPADAENRIRDAATPFIDLQALAVVSDRDGDHSLYGVLEPNVDKSSVGDEGVGTLVTIRGAENKALVNLIIGKDVKNAEGQRYVRRPGQSRVYIAKVDPNNLPVRFEDWIEKDLLQVNSFDIAQIELKDYSFEVIGRQIDYDQRHQFTISEDGGTWKLDEMLVAQNQELVPSELGDDEQLNQERLNELRDALDGLEIIDVQRKPEQLGADLKSDKGFANDQKGIDSLITRGFYPVTLPSGELEVLSADGEVQVRTKDGIEYVLRFGGIEGVDTESGEGSLNRYLMVSARLHDDSFPPPELEDVPQTVDDLPMPEAEEPSANDEDAAAASENADPADETTISEATEAEVDADDVTEVEPDTEADTNTETEASESVDENETTNPDSDATEPTQPDADQQSARPFDETTTLFVQSEDGEAAVDDGTDAAQSSSEDSASEDIAPEANAPEDSPSEEIAADGSGSDVAEPGPDASAQEGTAAESETAAETVDLEEKLKTEQERITKENQRKIDERNDKMEKAQEKVRELNYRFADWYYVISEEVYQKIHLDRDDVVEPATDDEAADASVPAAPGIGGSPFEGLNP